MAMMYDTKGRGRGNINYPGPYPAPLQRGKSVLLNEDGVTLIELIVVVTIIAVLVVVGGIQFVGWQANYRIESQVKEMYADLMNARSRAMQRNRTHFVVVAANNYQIFDDVNENGVPENNAIERWWTNPKPFNYPSLMAGSVIIDSRGLVTTVPLPAAGTEAFIRFNYDIASFNPDYDCILLGETVSPVGTVNPGIRINMGKWNGGLCVGS